MTNSSNSDRTPSDPKSEGSSDGSNESCSEELIRFLIKRNLKLKKRIASIKISHDQSEKINQDTNVRRISTFINKIRNFNSLSVDIQECLESEIKKYNLTKFLSEISSAVVSAKPSGACKISSLSLLCRIIAVQYKSFGNDLLKSLRHNNQIPNKDSDVDQIKEQVRLLIELICHGVFNEDTESLNSVKDLLYQVINAMVSQQSPEDYFRFLSVVIFICKQYSDEFLDRIPLFINVNNISPNQWNELNQKYQFEEDILQSNRLRLVTKAFNDRDVDRFHQILYDYYTKLQSKIKMVKNDLNQRKASNFSILQSKGEVGYEKQRLEQQLTTNLEQLKSHARNLNQFICDQIHEFTDDPIINTTVNNESYDEVEWESEEERSFYRIQPNLYEIFLKNKDESKQDTKPDNQSVVDIFLTNLNKLSNSEDADRLSAEYVFIYGSKQYQTKVISHICKFDKNITASLCGRFIYGVSAFYPSFQTELVSTVVKHFKYHLRKKDQTNLGAKLTRVRLIGELSKFKLIAPNEVFYCVKLLLANFIHHNIEMACALFDTCGKYLYRCLSTHDRCNAYLEIMIRKKQSLVFDDRYRILIDNAYTMCKSSHLLRDEVPLTKPINQCYPKNYRFLIFLITLRLSKVSIHKMVKSLCKLDWDDVEFMKFALHVFSQPQMIRFNHIVHLANLLCELSSYCGLHKLATEVADLVIEHLFSSLNNGMDSQQLLCYARYIAELYNFSIIDFQTLSKLLHLFILPSNDDFIRVRMICHILVVSGPCVDSDNMDSLIKYVYTFQCYYWLTKTHSTSRFTDDLDYFVRDALRRVDHSIDIAYSLEEAIQLLNEYCSIDIKDIPTNMFDGLKKREVENGKIDMEHDSDEIRANEEIIEMLKKETIDRQIETGRVNNKKGVYGIHNIPRDLIKNNEENFKLLIMKNNKPDLQFIDLKVSEEMQYKMMEEKRIADAERQELKRRTLNMSELQQIEEMFQQNNNISTI